MKKSLFFLLCIISISTLLLGCNNESINTEEKEVTNQEESKVIKVPEASSPSPIEEIVNSVSEDKIEEPIELPEQTKIVLPWPESYRRVDWFDLCQYLTDCGLEDITISDTIITATLYDWVFEIGTTYNNQQASLCVHNKNPEARRYYKVLDYTKYESKMQVFISESHQVLVHQITLDALRDSITSLYYFNEVHESLDPIDIEGFICYE